MTHDREEPVSAEVHEVADTTEALQILDRENLSLPGIAALRRLAIAGEVENGLDWLEIRVRERQSLKQLDQLEQGEMSLAAVGSPEGVLQRRLLSIRDDKDAQTAIFAIGMLGSLNAHLSQNTNYAGNPVGGEVVMAGIMHQGTGLLRLAERFLWMLEPVDVGPRRTVRLPHARAVQRVEEHPSGEVDFPLGGVENVVARVALQNERAFRQNLTIQLVKKMPPVSQP